jgi:hypothetical protein
MFEITEDAMDKNLVQALRARGEELKGEIFQPLKDVEYFKKFTVHPELHTLAWPNGADFAPEFLYDTVKVLA